MPLGVVGQDVGRVEPHRLVVEQGADELGRVVVLQPGRLVGEDGEGGGVALGEAVLGEAEQLLEDLLGGLRDRRPGASAPSRNWSQRRDHRLPRALAGHRAAELVGLAGAEAGQRHRHAEHLLLVEDDAERFPQDRFQEGMVVGRWAGEPRRASSRCWT